MQQLARLQSETNLRCIRTTCISLLILTCSQCLFAQVYPAKEIRVVVPYAPGGGSDVTSRILAKRMSETLGRQLVIDNRAGANGIIGTEMVARATADGYTLLFVSSPHAANPTMYRRPPFDTCKD